jgi:ribosomal protein S18 acetylase RimI-like enzyme
VTTAIHIASALSAADIADVRQLFVAYQRSISVDLCFQGFQAELAGLPGPYGPPGGALLLARKNGGAAVGCVALRALPAAGHCEMKRLYVTPEARGSGAGAALVSAILARGRALGYGQIYLDSLPEMQRAIALYRDFGFVDCAPYNDNRLPGMAFMVKMLPVEART